MGFLKRLFGKREKTPIPTPEHAVLVRFAYGSTDLSRLFALEEKLESAIAVAGAGEYDGNEVATDGSDARLYMYGPDADALFAAVRPVLEASAFMKGAQVTLRYGPPGAGVRESRTTLGGGG
jgi:hypothetical protein